MVPVIPYCEAYDLLNEGDVLLFRSKSWFGWFIKKYTTSTYSHAAITSRHNGIIEIIEFHGITGGVTYNLARAVKQSPGLIDVYRPSPIWTRILFNGKKTSTTSIIFTPEKARKISNTMRSLTGLPYGWKRIWWFAKKKLVGLRLFYKPEDLMDDNEQEIIYPVCSTAVAYSFSKAGFDVLKNKADNWTEPGHLALSTNLNKIFTLSWNDKTDCKFLE